MRRILIIGSSGAGKSTLGRALSARLDLPLVSLDALHWRPGWREPEESAWRQQVAAAVAGERWIIEGNYAGTIGLRLSRADTVLWLDYPRHVCLRRVLQRVARWHGRVRPDMAPGCPERLDLKFLAYVWTFPTRVKPRIVAALAEGAGHAHVKVLRNPRETARFLAGLGRD